MRIRKTDRLAAAAAALLLLAALVSAAAKLFFGYSFSAHLQTLLEQYPALRVVAGVVSLLIPAALLVWCCGLVFRRRREKGFVSQKAEDGSIDISFPALKRMVEECLAQHDELRCEALSVSQEGGGIIVEMTVALVRGVSVPLTISDLQKQIRRYVTACSGLEVREVTVKVDHELTDAEGTFRYAITDMLQPALPESAKAEPEAPETETAVPERYVSVFERAEVEVNMPPKPDGSEQPAPAPAPEEPQPETETGSEEEEDDFVPFDEWSIPAPMMSTLSSLPVQPGEAPAQETVPEVLAQETVPVPEETAETAAEAPEETAKAEPEEVPENQPEQETAVENNA